MAFINKIVDTSGKLIELKEFLSSSKGRDILLYLVFVIISFAFWAILSLNNLIQDNYKVMFRITGIPQGVTMINDYPREFNVTVKNNGYVLLKYMIGDNPEITVDFKKYANGNGQMLISRQELEDMLVAEFGSGTSIVSFSPESLSIKYTSLPGKKVPVEIFGDYVANFQYVVNGEIVAVPDSVTIYSDAGNLSAINKVRTEKIISRNLTDSLYVKIAIQNIKDVRAVPDSVDVMIPVEPLVTKRSSIPVIVKNLPENVSVVVFPSYVQVSYLLPMSLYNDRLDDKFEASVDYGDIQGNKAKLPVRIEIAPEIYQNIQLETDSVEYVIEN